MEVGVGYPGQNPIRMVSFSDTVPNLPMVSLDLGYQVDAVGDWFHSKAMVDPPCIRMKACRLAWYVSSNPCEADWLQSDYSSWHESCLSFRSKL
jgi:hypothetical protein